MRLTLWNNTTRTDNDSHPISNKPQTEPALTDTLMDMSTLSDEELDTISGGWGGNDHGHYHGHRRYHYYSFHRGCRCKC